MDAGAAADSQSVLIIRLAAESNSLQGSPALVPETAPLIRVREFQKGDKSMHLSREIYWHDLGPEWPHTVSLRFDPHPKDFEAEDLDWPDMVEHMNERNAELAELTIRLGEGDRWSGHFRGNPFRKESRACTNVVDMGAGVVVEVAQEGPVDQAAETMIIVPVSRVEKFVPAHSVEHISGLTGERRAAVIADMENALDLYKCGSLVFSTNAPMNAWLNVGPVAQDFRPTLVRAILRWALRRDGVSLDTARPNPRNGDPVVYKDAKRRAHRFSVRPPLGMGFSNAFIHVLKDLGYHVAEHPDCGWEGGDGAEWFASKSQPHLDELLAFLKENDTSTEAFETAFRKRVEELGDVVCAGFDWKHLDVEGYASSLAEAFGFKMRWAKGGGPDGRDLFYQFLIEV